MKTVNVDLVGKGSALDRSYEILIERGLIDETGPRLIELGELGAGRRAVLITNPTVMGLYGKKIINSLEGAGFSVVVIEMPDGEEFKNLDEASKVYDRLIEEKLDRGSPIVALGGGVVGDLAGFVAATYLRGVPYVQVPTTLLAQVDSSVGGKTAVNHPKGKNLIGSFYQPKMVIIDPDVLSTLDEREVRTGLAEVVKHGVIRDKDYFEFLELNAKKVLGLSAEIDEAIERSCQIKASVVSEDERETGLRAILNFGHTFGHAIEAVAGYSTYRHGEAVSMGMVMAAGFSVELGLCDTTLVDRIRGLLDSLGLPTAVPKLSPDDILASIFLDKKVKAGRVNFVLLKGLAQVVVEEVDEDKIGAYLKKVFQ